MDENDKLRAETQIRLAAIEYLLVDLSARYHRLMGTPLEAVKLVNQDILDKIGTHTSPELDPAMSDYGWGEFQDKVRALLEDIQEVLES